MASIQFAAAVVAVAQGFMAPPPAVMRHRPSLQSSSICMQEKQPSMADLREFMKYDHDQNMALDYDEFCAMQSEKAKDKYTEEQLRAWFNAVDTDGNGTIDVNEFFAMKDYQLEPPPAQPVAQPPAQPSMADLREFMSYDHDQNMQLDFDEFLAMQKPEVRSFSDEQLKAWFDEADTDGNGYLDPNEYFAMSSLLARAAKVKF